MVPATAQVIRFPDSLAADPDAAVSATGVLGYTDSGTPAGAVPFRDFGLADTISVSIGGVSTPRVVLEIGGQAENVNAIIRWTIKTGPVLT